MAALDALPFDVPDEAVREAMTKVYWPGRLQRLTEGPLASQLPDAWELWLDGGHNDSAGEILAAQMRRWQANDAKPIDLVYGMLSTKTPSEFLAPLAPFIRRLRTVYVEGEVKGFAADELAAKARACGIEGCEPAADIQTALADLISAGQGEDPARILFCGSLYLVAAALRA